jgi:hypothetical protein
MIDPDSDLMKTFTLMENEFPQSAGSGMTAKVSLLWGGKGLDKSKVPAWNTTYKGDVIFDQDFPDKFHLPENQIFQKETCEKLKGVQGIIK